MNKYAKDDLNGCKYQIKVGELKALLERNNVPDDAIIMYHRIEDLYFENEDERRNWKVYLSKGMFYHQVIELDGANADPEFLDRMCDQMILAESAWYDREINALMITAHI